MARVFEIGKLVATDAVYELMESNNDFKSFVSMCVNRYILNDWGDTLPEHRKENDEAVRKGGRVIAFYHIPEEIEETFEDQLWLVTEEDRSKTTIMFVSDY